MCRAGCFAHGYMLCCGLGVKERGELGLRLAS